MNDLISRQAAIDALDGVFDNVPMQLTTEILRLRRELRGLTSADVVPVVRCKDCKHWDNGKLSFECPWDYGRYGSSDEDDFCSYGERKE